MAVGEGAVWATRVIWGRGVEHELARIDPLADRAAAIVRLHGFGSSVIMNGNRSVAAGEGAVWIVNAEAAGTVSRIDPQTNRVVATIPVGGYPSAWSSKFTRKDFPA
jgi:YVTN family beta-propeller protein